MDNDKPESFLQNKDLYEFFNINCESTMKDLKLSYKKVK